MKRQLASFLFSMFFTGTTKRRATASTVGFAFGLLQGNPYIGLILILIGFLFRLNLLALFTGFLLSYVIVAGEWVYLYFFQQLIPNTIHYGIYVLTTPIAYLFFLTYYRDGILSGDKKEKPFVFYDDGKRWKFYKKSFLIILICTLMNTAFFIGSLYEPMKAEPLITEVQEDIKPIQEPLTNLPKKTVYPKTYSNKKVPTYAFYVPWDENSYTQLTQSKALETMDTLIPEWYGLDENGSLVINRDPMVDKLAKEKKINIMPMINNLQHTKGNWSGDLLHTILVNPEKRSRLIQQLLTDIKAQKYQGINIDFQNIESSDLPLFTSFMKELYQQFHAAGLQVTQDIPLDDPGFDYEELGDYADYFIVMAYDQHHTDSKAGPISSLSWLEQSLSKLPIPAEKQIVSLGNYGYDWTLGTETVSPVSFREVMQLADKNQLKVQWDSTSSNGYLRYQKEGEEHQVWFLDALSFYNQLRTVRANSIAGVAVWRLGTEDPAIWDIVNTSNPKEQLQVLQANSILFTGKGEILRVSSKSHTGKRELRLSQKGWIQEGNYINYPKYPLVQKFGANYEKKVVLTFDDGPDPEYTNDILKILREKKVPATFFLLGQNALLHPGVVKTMYEDGHELGNHTFFHPVLADSIKERIHYELNATNRVIQAITKRTPNIYRPPYQATPDPVTMKALLSIERAQESGLTMIGENIDTLDWQKPSPQEMIKMVEKQLENGNMILLHDAGGDRTSTVKALPILIDTLHQKGYQIVTVGELLGHSRDLSLLKLTVTDRAFLPFQTFMCVLIEFIQDSLKFLFYTAIGIGFIRVLFLIYLSYKQRRTMRKRGRKLNYTQYHNSYKPLVSVVIAAYNEEKVIKKTIESVLQSDYAKLEILIINDGSTDQTEQVILNHFGSHPNVHVITKANGGKTAAINLGYQEAMGELIVSIDADTIIATNTINLLVRHFQNPEVAAVSGNVKVGNVNNIVTTWQHVEYVTGFNLERRAFDELNCIPVVPGAIGAWRKSAIEEVGYFQHDTLAEDTDITLNLLRKGYHVHYEDKAYAYTEAPEDLKSLLKQRTRWIYGTLQCLWKHRGALFSKEQRTLGYISLPNMWLFQYGVQMLSPFIDLLCIVSLFTGEIGNTLLFYLLFLAFDTLAAFIAFRFEKESTKPLLWLFVQRFAYRLLMTIVVCKSIFFALKGITVGWNKLARSGNVGQSATEIENKQRAG
ncbi:glycosyltransferase [Risungbinella massiliensis]|uniref:glycosyltransferase n=1 Tax=Risungbinella massiliensis TaxID=1329796 RepID=UPI00069C3B2C|nr:glycosyltransferase [Risungbinella massiliensis]